MRVLVANGYTSRHLIEKRKLIACSKCIEIPKLANILLKEETWMKGNTTTETNCVP